MGWGKILGMAALGVGAVAAAPFTGGGSLLGAASLGASLAGAGAVAAGAGITGAAAGAVISSYENDEIEAQERRIAAFNQKAKKTENVLKEHEKHINLILALTAIGCSMANADGEISSEEKIELVEYVGGLSAKSYPSHVLTQIEDMISNPPTFNEAMEHLTKVDSIEFAEIRNLLVMIMESDEVVHKKEEAFLKAFDNKVVEIVNIG